MPMIISASRRTDIPALYGDWFFHKLGQGFVHSKNPYNRKQIKKIDLSPKEVTAFVFWTKNPRPIIEKLHLLKDYAYYFHFTLNDYSREVESGVPPLKQRIEIFKRLSSVTGPLGVVWRYDPIFLSPKKTLEQHIESFESLASQLSGYTDQCITSILTDYARTKRNMRQEAYSIPNESSAADLLNQMKKIAHSHGMEIRTCCTPTEGIEEAACIDRERIEKITERPIDIKKDKNQRAGCGCLKSVDIGSYETCTNNCLYCYARMNHKSSLKHRRNHLPGNDFIEGNLLDFTQGELLPL